MQRLYTLACKGSFIKFNLLPKKRCTGVHWFANELIKAIVFRHFFWYGCWASAWTTEEKMYWCTLVCKWIDKSHCITWNKISYPFNILQHNETCDHYCQTPSLPLKRNLPNIETREQYKLVTSHHIQLSRSMAKQLYIRGAFKIKKIFVFFIFFPPSNIVFIRRYTIDF